MSSMLKLVLVLSLTVSLIFSPLLKYFQIVLSQNYGLFVPKNFRSLELLFPVFMMCCVELLIM